MRGTASNGGVVEVAKMWGRRGSREGGNRYEERGEGGIRREEPRGRGGHGWKGSGRLNSGMVGQQI